MTLLRARQLSAKSTRKPMRPPSATPLRWPFNHITLNPFFFWLPGFAMHRVEAYIARGISCSFFLIFLLSSFPYAPSLKYLRLHCSCSFFYFIIFFFFITTDILPVNAPIPLIPHKASSLFFFSRLSSAYPYIYNLHRVLNLNAVNSIVCFVPFTPISNASDA